MVSLLRVFYIMHTSLCLPLLWLARNCADLRKFGYGVVDTLKAVDLTYKAFAETNKGRNLMLNDDFMMHIFEPLSNKTKLFTEYLY